MKLNRIVALCGVVATLCVSARNVTAQDNGSNNPPPGDATSDTQGGGRRNRGGGNFDPAQFQQRMMERVRTNLGFTNDTDWSAVQPLVQKVVDTQREARFGGMSRLFGRNRGGNNADQGSNNRSSIFGQSSPEAEALQKAIDDNAPAGQIKDLLKKYKAAQKEKQAKLVAAQADLRKVLTVKQEAAATLSGLLD